LIKPQASDKHVMKEKLNTGQRITWRSLTFQLLAIVVFPLIVLILIITFGSSTLHENAMRGLVGERDERAARMASTAIEDQVQRRANAVRGLAGQVSYASIDRSDEILLNAAYLLADFDAGLAVIGKDGQVIAVQGDSEIWGGSTGLVMEGLKALRDDTELLVYLSTVTVQPDQQAVPMVVMAPVSGGRGVVAGAFYINSIVQRVFANVIPSNQGAFITLAASDGSILYQNGAGSQEGKDNQHVGVAEALAGKHGTTYITVGGSEHVVAFSPVTPFGWALLIEEPWERVASPILQTTHTAPLVMVPVLLLSLLALFFGIRQIVQPLQTLANQSSKLGWGDYGAIEKPVGGVSEIRQLQLELIHMAHKLRAAQQSLHSYIGAITSGQEDERRRLARELHDDTIQSLIAFKQQIQLAEMDWEGHPVVKALNHLEIAGEQTIENLRRMISALRPIYLEDLGLVAAMNMLASDTSEKLGSPVEFFRQGKERRLEAPVELALYRIGQEALNNITRHSGATHATIQMSFQADGIKIVIEDNGKGFAVPRSPAEFAPSGHFGLLGMFERVDLIGGEIQVDSNPGKGTRVKVKVTDDHPISPTEA
jgi:signal transduction histidine kinase